MKKGGSNPEYEIIEAFNPNKKYSIPIQNRHKEILSTLTNIGEKFTPSQFYESHLDLLKRKNRPILTN